MSTSMEPDTIYFDSAATTPLDAQALAAMLPFMTERFANPSSAHRMGLEARRAIEQARRAFACALDADEEGIVFTSGGSEANNLALRGLAPRLSGRRIIVSRLEHPSVHEPARVLAAQGFEVVTIHNDEQGYIDLDHLSDLLLAKKTALVAIIHGSNEIGTVQDVAAIGRLIRAVSPESWLHLDAIQSAGYLPLKPRDWQVDSLTFSAHKLHGPKGAGVLALYRRAALEPLVAGGGQERGRRSGTENTAAIAGAAAALDLNQSQRQERADHVTRLKLRLQALLAERIPDLRFNGDPASGLPHILSVSLHGILGEVLLHHLEREGLMVSAGSACHSNSTAVSPTIEALGMPGPLARGTIRLSLSHRNTAAEVERAVEIIAEQVEYLREVGKP